MTREYTAVIEKHGRWYVAWVEELPGANTQGRTLAEVRGNLRDAIEGILALNREMAVKEKRRASEVRREPILVEV